jgi:hypothetical protein
MSNEYGKLAYISLSEDGKTIEIAIEKGGRIVKARQDFAQSRDAVQRLLEMRMRLPEITESAAKGMRPEIVGVHMSIADPFWNIAPPSNAQMGGVDMWVYIAGYDWVALQIPKPESDKLAKFIAEYAAPPAQAAAAAPQGGETSDAEKPADEPKSKTLH